MIERLQVTDVGELRREIERLRAQLVTCQELRTRGDARTIHRLRARIAELEAALAVVRERVPFGGTIAEIVNAALAKAEGRE